MTFFKTFLAATAASALVAACGGGEPSAPSSTENTVENSGLSADSSENSPAAPTAAREPSPEFASLPAPYSEADYARGRRTFRLCQSCHTLSAEGQNLVGPKLHGVFGRPVGSIEGFTYSTAVSDAAFIWTPEKLDEWLTSPRNFLPGNKMSFAGVQKPQDRLAVIAYIMAESGYTGSDE